MGNEQSSVGKSAVHFVAVVYVLIAQYSLTFPQRHGSNLVDEGVLILDVKGQA